MLLDIANTIRLTGGRLLLVGGSVRDQFLGRVSKDVDCEVFGLSPERLRAILSVFGEVNCVGASFGVYKLGDFDFSIPRRDSKSGAGHRGFIVSGDPDMSFADAARRRDFTMNAISQDPLTGEFIDPFHGRADIRDRVLRIVDFDRFGDDPLRVLRAVQFAARFECSIDAQSFALMCQMQSSLSELPAERVWGEFAKLLQADEPSIGLRAAHALGVVQELWPELYALIGCEQDPEWHPEGDVWRHTLQVVDEARATWMSGEELPIEALAVMLAALCHDFGKPSTTKFDGKHIRALGHEAASVELTRSFLERLNVQTIDGYDVRAQVLALVGHHMLPHEFHRQDPGKSAFRRLSRKVDLMLLARLADADANGRYPKPKDSTGVDWFIDRVKELDLQDGPPPSLLMGRHLLDLGMSPGPEIGRIIKLVFEKQLDGSVTTVDEAIAEAKRHTTFVRVDGETVPLTPMEIAGDWKLRGL